MCANDVGSVQSNSKQSSAEYQHLISIDGLKSQYHSLRLSCRLMLANFEFTDVFFNTSKGLPENYWLFWNWSSKFFFVLRKNCWINKMKQNVRHLYTLPYKLDLCRLMMEATCQWIDYFHCHQFEKIFLKKLQNNCLLTKNTNLHISSILKYVTQWCIVKFWKRKEVLNGK